MFTLQRKAKLGGYYARERFGTRSRDEIQDEIALNPVLSAQATDERILSVLVHEMTHLEQFRLHPDTCSRPGYHNRAWGDLMRRVGLIPSHTGAPGGRAMGQQMDHYIEPGGPFARAAQDLLATGWRVPYVDLWDEAKRRSGRESKTRYTCPRCGQNAWAKPKAKLVCGACTLPMAAERRDA